MITKAEKQYKIKLIGLILILHAEYGRRNPFKDVWQAISYGMESVKWVKELQKVSAQRTIESIPNYEKGCIVSCGENKQPEIILRK